MTTNVIEILQEAFVNVCKSDNICQAIKEASIEVYEKIGEIMNYYGGSEWLKESKMEVMPFTKGNSKLPTSTYIFNMGTGLLCAGRALGLCQCSHCCYAQDAEKKAKIAIWSKEYTDTRNKDYSVPHTNYHSYTNSFLHQLYNFS